MGAAFQEGPAGEATLPLARALLEAHQIDLSRPCPLESLKVDNLEVEIYRTAADAGYAAAWDDLSYLLALQHDGEVPVLNGLAARARSQLYRWHAHGGGLSNPEGLGKLFPFEALRVVCMDEFWNQPIEHPGSLSAEFRSQVPADFFAKLQLEEFHPCAPSIEAEMARYAGFIRQACPDNLHLAQTGIGTGRADGTSPHKAFMDYPWASANPHDPRVMMAVELPQWCREQQFNDFGPAVYPHIDDVPQYALSVTMAVILSAKRISCLVPGAHKANAVNVTLTRKRSPENPATLMRAHQNATLYLDLESAGVFMKQRG